MGASKEGGTTVVVGWISLRHPQRDDIQQETGYLALLDWRME